MAVSGDGEKNELSRDQGHWLCHWQQCECGCKLILTLGRNANKKKFDIFYF